MATRVRRSRSFPKSSYFSSFQVIVVDGPIASGKSAVAKALADELDMLYVPDVTMDKMYVNDYGFDMRTLNSTLPHMARAFDEKDFCRNPRDVLVANFQIEKYVLRFSEYIDSLAHLLSTGQGVVVDRSCYSDFVFLEAMFKSNMLSRDVRRVYYELKQNTIGELLRPHLAIYLDVPVAQTMANIKKRNHEWEVKSPALTEKFLTDMEVSFKQEYLKEISNHAELLIYDWSDGGDVEVVVEDIERIGEWRGAGGSRRMSVDKWRFPRFRFRPVRQIRPEDAGLAHLRQVGVERAARPLHERQAGADVSVPRSPL